MAAKKTETTVDVGGRVVKLTNQEKVLFPNDGYTKGDLVAYYRAVAPVILPYLRDNPLTMERFPDGIAAHGIWEKHAPRGDAGLGAPGDDRALDQGARGRLRGL